MAIDDEERRRIAKEARDEAKAETALEGRVTSLEGKFRVVAGVIWAGAGYLGIKILDFLTSGFPK